MKMGLIHIYELDLTFKPKYLKKHKKTKKNTHTHTIMLVKPEEKSKIISEINLLRW